MLRDNLGIKQCCVTLLVFGFGIGMGSCSGTKVVSESAFKFAQFSSKSISEDLPAGECCLVLEELGRIDMPNGWNAGDVTTLAFSSNKSIAISAPHMASQQVAIKRVDRPSTILSNKPYFASLTAIAVKGGLDPTPIPGVAMGVRPNWSELWIVDSLGLDGWLDGAGAGVDMFVGGAVGPGGSGSSDVELALGVGLNFPWSDNGAFSIGVVKWRGEDDFGSDTELAGYFGVNLGNFKAFANGE